MSKVRKNKEPLTPANAGEMEVAMGDTSTATPPAASGGLTKEDVKALLGELLSPIAGTLKTLTEGHASLAQTLKTVEDQAAKAATPETIAKLVTEQVTAAETARQATSAKTQARGELVKKIIAAKLPGVPEALIKLPDSDDEKVLGEAADALRKSIESLPGVKLADVGGAAASGSDGGKTPAKEDPSKPAQKYTPKNTGIAEGTANYANAIDAQIQSLNAGK